MKKENNPVLTIIIGIVSINIFIGFINGCSTYLINDNFSEGFFESAGWVLKLSIVVIYILILSGLIGIFSNKKK